MEIVVPNRIEIVATFAAGTDELGNLPLVFGDQNDRAWSSGFAGGPANCADDVFVRFIMNRIGGVEAEAVEVEFVDPVTAVGDVKFADRRRVGPVEIN